MTVTTPAHMDIQPGDRLFITAGTGAGQEFVVTSVSFTTLTVRGPRWWERLRWCLLAWMAGWDARFAARYETI